MGRGPTVAGFTSSVKKLCVSFVAMLALFVYRPGCSWAQESAVSNPQLRMQLGPPVPGSSGGAAPALAAASTETFERFQRYPVEDQSFSSMSGTPPTAYYRDEFVGGETFASGANEGHDLRAALQFKWRSHSDLEQHRFSQQLCF